ncbi:hypothetical protein AB205_0120380, partial [Aquarana catesbeiana]
ELCPPSLDIKEEELGDLVEKEMAATAAAVETAAARIEEMLKKSRTDDTGLKLQVNEQDAADLVVQGQGKFEDIIVCSHEIAASTAQLVAASKVKAEKNSTNLTKLMQASKVVNHNAAGVVASTKSVKSQIDEVETMDFSTLTLTQIKRQEMDTQVRVLELESQLQKEREKLGDLRKKHYELAGVSEGWGDGK